MLEPICNSEKLLFSTVRIVASGESKGTGFFFTFKINGGFVPTIITNKHVINENEEETVTFFLHIKDSEESLEIAFKPKWLFHDRHDLCLCFVNPLFEEIKKRNGKEIMYSQLNEDIIWNKTKLQDLGAIEDVVMVGYPIGLWDEKNNMPLFRKGITASHPALDFNGESIGVVDMACFPGSSGSPIFVLNENGYSHKKGNSYIGATRFVFLGILYQGPQFNSAGDLIIEDVPTQLKIRPIVPQMINIGYYIKASEILAFSLDIKKLLPKKISDN